MNPENDEACDVIGECVKKSIINDLKTVTNNFERANLLRESGYILFHESAKDEELASLVLDDVLESYKTVVTSTGENSVNNYTDRVVQLLKKSRRAIDVAKWKPLISREDIQNEDIINECKGKYEDCRHREVTAAALNTFHRSLNNKTPKRKLDEVSTEKDEDDVDMNFSDMSIFEKEHFPGLTDDPVSRIETPKITSNQQTEVKLNANLFRKTDCSVVSDKSSHTSVEDSSKIVGNSFRTARDELSLQNLRKYGNKNNPEPSFSDAVQNRLLSGSVHQPQGSRLQPPQHQQPLFSYGASKKSLGARRTVQSKFIPPVKNSEEASGVSSNTGQGAAENESDLTDERLKNIEPKMIELISNEIMTKFKPVSWNDIAGLNYAKATIQEAVVWPMLRPDIFTGLRRPPRGILLFGPPGTGKTLIGKCIASQSKSTFFSISASSLTSKWIGDGEKMVRALFAVAAVHQPSVIFIDEVDSLLCQRSETEHESSRRIKTEFLVQLDGAMTSEEERILIVGATNRPQELDEAARRRFTRRLYIPLPEQEARLQILNNLLQSVKHSLTESDIENVGKLACGYSGADMESLCREASMEPIRSIPPDQILYFNENEVRPINLADFRQALNRIRASVSQNDLQHYVRWNEIYGSGISY